MALVPEKKLLFIHLNKSCGNIVMYNLFSNFAETMTIHVNDHMTLQEALKVRYPSKEQSTLRRRDLTIFATVRNPFDRMVSIYHFYKEAKMGSGFTHPDKANFYSGDRSIDDDFNRWIQYIYSSSFDRERLYHNSEDRSSHINIFKYCFCNQLNWFIDGNGDLANDVKLIKIEDGDLKNYLLSLGLNNVDTETRINATNHEHYSRYYSDASIDLVAKHYADDIEYFSYKFESK